VVAGLAAAGILSTAGRWRLLLPLYLAGGSYMASVILFFNFGRFRLPFLPILFVFAGAGAVALWHGLRALRRPAGAAPPAARRAGIVLPLLAGAVWAGTLVDLHSSAEEPFQDRLHLGAAYRQAGRLDEAEAILRRTIRDAEEVLARRGWKRGDPAVPGGISFAFSLHAAHRDLAGILLDQGRTAEGIEELQSAIPLVPNDADLFQILGGALLTQGEAAAAVRAHRRAVRLQPDAFTKRFDLATALYESGDPASALVELERARERDPSLGGLDLADWHIGMGTVLLALPGREEEAMGHLKEGLELNPSHPQAGEVRPLLSGRR
jgi:tetratricopeptide (TPR) repeat protein